MKNENSYIKIRKWFYHKFDSLDSLKLDTKIEFYDKNDDNILRVYIANNECEIFYYEGFKDDLIKIVPISTHDFEIFLTSWFEDNFKIKVTFIHLSSIS